MIFRRKKYNLVFTECEYCGKEIKIGISTEILTNPKKRFPNSQLFSFITCEECDKKLKEEFEKIYK
ncbi:hypothetical protein HHOHNEGG_00012 [Clostridium phage LPCPA6]|uniref:Uncharacterized protein n=1 Tax=Clostridium phage LPCPA6 TaxID=2924884 RepID=A0AAE9GDA2_9CAUD|nr:hypothetical protein PQC33_gp12 [Clostridium phage LPCPA6]UNY47189.1 hypothetical protein HHOHNEGG_00012 [Clostridium phage LPCPA6]